MHVVVSKLTSIIILSIRAVLLHLNLTTVAEPPGLAPTLPLQRKLVNLALAVPVALPGTPFQTAVAAVPAVGAEAGSVGADPVGGAPRVALPLAAIPAGPTGFAHADVIAFAGTVRAAV